MGEQENESDNYCQRGGSGNPHYWNYNLFQRIRTVAALLMKWKYNTVTERERYKWGYQAHSSLSSVFS